jgi:site-specific DNA recombinase
MRVIIAARLSSLADAQNQSGLVSQEQESLAYCKMEGHQVVAVAADYAKGRTDMMKRPNLRPWVEDPDRIALYEGIVAYKLDRLTRGDTAETRRLEQWADDHSKKLIIVGGPEYPCEGTDGVVWDVLKRQAHQEWLNTSERYRRMQATKRAGGYVSGRQPYGYRLVQGERGKLIEVDPVTSAIVQEMADKFLNGGTLRGIAEWLNESAISTPTGAEIWHYTVVRRILKSQSVIGRRVNAAGEVELEYEPIIEMDIWNKVQAKMEKMPRKPRDDFKPSLLTGISMCAQCGMEVQPVRHNRKRKDGTVHVNAYYRCRGRNGKSACKNYTPMADADEQVEMFMTQFLGPLELAKLTLIKGENNHLKIQDVELKIRNLDFDDPDYDSKQAELRAERARLKELPPGEDKIESAATGEAIAQHWAALGDDIREKNKFLREGGLKIYFAHRKIAHVDASVILDGSGDGWGITRESARKFMETRAVDHEWHEL